MATLVLACGSSQDDNNSSRRPMEGNSKTFMWPHRLLASLRKRWTDATSCAPPASNLSDIAFSIVFRQRRNRASMLSDGYLLFSKCLNTAMLTLQSMG